MSDTLRKKLRETGQAPSSRDRVGGGMQRSEAKPLRRELDRDEWIPSSSCVKDFHYVKFESGEFLCACECLTAWYKE